jgi:Flp pilus assembly protein TadG
MNRGGAVLEMALLAPWIFFLFIGALDWGFYSYALISMQAATRTATLYASSTVANATDSTTACTLVLGEMANLPNVSAGCTSNPTVTASLVTGIDSQNAAQVTVTYQSVSLIPIPGLLAKQFTITRVARMKIRG